MIRLLSVLVTGVLVVIITMVLIPSSHQLTTKLRQNDSCITSDGQDGTCKKLSDCPKGIDLIQSGARPKTCGFSDDTLVICCPPDPSKPSVIPLSNLGSASNESQQYALAVKKAKEKCREYGETVILKIASPILVTSASGIETVDTCARLEEPLVVGGENSKPKEFPHMALIGYGDVNAIWLCGGTLISERFIISAAHCSRSPTLGVAKWAKVGDLDTSTDTDDALPDVFKIVERLVYPKYNRDFLYNDIALFKLEYDVEISAYVRPLCLFTSNDIPQDQVIATGWGHTSWDNSTNYLRNKINGSEVEGDVEPWDEIEKQRQIEFESGTASPSLMKVKLKMVSSEKCDDKYKPSRGTKLVKGILDESQICAGDEVGKDTCQGDSGGPLQIPLKEPYCMYGLIGITSFGKSCGTGYPGVYTRVSHYLPWIVESVWPE